MENLVKLLINNNEVLQYDKSINLPDNQSKYLNMMDKKMEQGISLGEQFINKPDQLQKAQFVTFNMLALLDKNEEHEAIAMFTYLVNYLNELKQVKVIGETGKYKIEFVFYKDQSNWQTVQFH
ncbi:MAG: hypothetical protein QM479_02520 [Pseudomonadota bacterium]